MNIHLNVYTFKIIIVLKANRRTRGVGRESGDNICTAPERQIRKYVPDRI